MVNDIYFDDFGMENEDDLSQKIEAFDQAVIWGADWTTETLTNQLCRNNIDLSPKFQRRDAWSIIAKSKFIESLILGLPIPPVILAEKKDKKGEYIVIDGKQRLLTIRQFFSESDEDEFTSWKLKGLDVLPQLNGSSYLDIENDSTIDSILNQLLNQTIRTVVIKNWPNEEFLFAVFLRMNTGSIKLSPQELRQALHPGKFIDFADEFSVNSVAVKKMLRLEQPDYRMRDVEMVVRYYTFKYFLKEYTGNLKKAFDDTVLKLNQNWDSKKEQIKSDANALEEAISFTIDTFGHRESFSKWTGERFQSNFNRAIFDIMIYYFSNSLILEAAKSFKTEIVEKFKKLCVSDSDFILSFEHTTKSIPNTIKRLETWGNALSEVLDIDIAVPYLENNRISGKSF